MGVLLYFCGVAFGHVNTLTLPVHRTHLSFTRRSVLNRLSLDRQKAGASITARLYYSIKKSFHFTLGTLNVVKILKTEREGGPDMQEGTVKEV